MTMRKKTLLIIGVTVVSSIVLLYAAATSVLLSSFARIEEQDTHQDVQRVLSAFSDELANISSITRDYASWDDTYAFIDNANEEYPQVNLVDETFTNLRLNIVVFVHSSGRIVLSKAFDLHKEQEMPFPESLNEHLSTSMPLLQHSDPESNLTGILLLPEGPLLVSSRPILTSEYQGPIRGTLIFGRYLDPAEIEQLAETTHLSLSVFRFDAPELPPDFQAARASLSETLPILIQPLNKQSVAGYSLIKDIYKQPALLLRIDRPRTIYQQGQASLRYFLMSLLMVGPILGAVALLLSERFVLSRLAHLNAEVSKIGMSGGLSARVSLTGRDELGDLAEAINEMLAELEVAERERLESAALRESERRMRQRAAQLQVVAEVSHIATTLLDPEQLIVQVVQLIQERFGFYYVGLFLLDEQSRYAVLQHGTGEVGRAMKEQGYRLEVGGQSMVGQVCAGRLAHILQDVGDDPIYRVNPLLPDSRSEMVVPLRVGRPGQGAAERISGALDLHSAQARAFDETNTAALQSIADQVAVALENARLFQQTQIAFNEIEAANRLLTRQGWQRYLEQPQTVRRTEFGTTHHSAAEPSSQSLIVPLELHGQSIGRLVLGREGGRVWSDDEIEMVKTITVQTALAVDNARLLDEAQRRAAREQLTGEITTRMRETLDIDTVLQTAIREIGEALGIAEVEVRMLGGSTVESQAKPAHIQGNGHSEGADNASRLSKEVLS